jgi:murein DD-endopeptidase MepM/ murein hydrolase activator NlpD
MQIRRLIKPLLIVLLSAGQIGCNSIYDNYGYGRLAPAKRTDGIAATPVSLPSNAATISQRFRPVAATADSSGGHNGIDLLIPLGTPVLAAADGIVSRIQFSILYGNQIFIDHGKDSQGRQLQTRYFHLDEPLVATNQPVSRGDQIGWSGLSGLFSGGFAHLHFEVHHIGYASEQQHRVLDPQIYWVDGVGMVTCFEVNQSWPETPTLFTYPAPCQGISWN